MIELLRQRRSIRIFQDKPIEKEKIEILKEALLRSPSSRNICPWEFIFVDDKKLLVELSKTKQHGSAFLSKAVLCVVVLGDFSKSDVWIEDCSIASILLQMTAQSLGLGSCWIQIRNRKQNHSKTSEEYIRNLLNIPNTLHVESIIGLGYAAEDKEGIPYNSLQFNKITTNRYRESNG